MNITYLEVFKLHSPLLKKFLSYYFSDCHSPLVTCSWHGDCWRQSRCLREVLANIFDLRMLKRRSESTEITPLVNSAVEKLQELGNQWEILSKRQQPLSCIVRKFAIYVVGHHVRTRREGGEPVDTSGVDVVVKALKDLVDWNN